MPVFLFLGLKAILPSFLRQTIEVPVLYNSSEVFNIENKKFRARSRRLPDAVSHVIQITILKHHQHSLHSLEIYSTDQNL
jgi:hypothetical protein